MLMCKLRLRALALLLAVSCLGSFAALAASEPCPRIEFGVFHEEQKENTRSVRGPQGRTLFFEQTPITRLQDISRAHLGSDEATVLVSLKAEAAERLKTVTTGNSGVRLAFVVDDEAVLAVVWEGEYGFESGEMQLSLRNEDVAQKLVMTIGRCIEQSPVEPPGRGRFGKVAEPAG